MKDKLLNQYLKNEKKRQNNTIELIASENFTSKEVRKMCGSILTNKYAEGYPSKRYYGGCFNIDDIESLAKDRLIEIFKAEKYHANVQPHSGSQANMAVYKAMLNLGDTILSMDLNCGGHLTHGSPVSFSGKEYNIVSYGVNKKTEMLDYEEIERLALECKPKLIVTGASSYARTIDFKKFRQIADKVGAYLMADVAHIAGLIVAQLHPSPIGYADFVTSTTHKTLRGPRGGIILCKKEYAKKIDSAIFPGIQGGPLEHIIAGKCQCFYEASKESFFNYQKQVIRNINAMEEVFNRHNVKLVSGGSDNHMILVNTKASFNLSGKEAETILDKIGITCNKNMIPFDPEKANTTSGIRLGSAAMTTKGLKEEDFKEIAEIIVYALKGYQLEKVLKQRVKSVVRKCKYRKICTKN